MKTILNIKFVTIAFLVSMSCHLRAGILTGPVTNAANGHIYYLLTATNWVNLEKEGVSLGGHLATINDAAEDQWVFTNFARFASVTLAIGLNDRDVEGTHRWVSGEESTYRNSAGTEPNNANGGENVDGIWTN